MSMSLLLLHGVQDTDRDQGGTNPPQGRPPGRMAGGAWPGSFAPAPKACHVAAIQIQRCRCVEYSRLESARHERNQLCPLQAPVWTGRACYPARRIVRAVVISSLTRRKRE